MHVPKVVVADGLFSQGLLSDENATGRVDLRYGSLGTATEVRAETADADAIMVTVQPLPADLISALGPRVRIIGRAGIGLDAIDLDAAKDRGMAVFHTPDYCIDEVANHALAMLLALYRRLPQSDVVARTAWASWRTVGMIRPLSDLTVGIVGYGRIGRAFARRLAPLSARIMVYDPWLDEPTGFLHAESLDQLLSTADIVSLHLPLTNETRGLIGERTLALMRSGSILINVSRGGLVDETALADALKDGRLAGAGLDVMASEPPAADSPLFSAPNALLSPHTAWYSTGSEDRVWRETIDGVLAYLHDQIPETGRIAVKP